MYALVLYRNARTHIITIIRLYDSVLHTTVGVTDFGMRHANENFTVATGTASTMPNRSVDGRDVTLT